MYISVSSPSDSFEEAQQVRRDSAPVERMFEIIKERFGPWKMKCLLDLALGIVAQFIAPMKALLDLYSSSGNPKSEQIFIFSGSNMPMQQLMKLDDLSESSSSHNGVTSARAVPVPELPRMHEGVSSSCSFAY
ncbi:hypothetical protein Tsubulata_029295 [Turnera subulata]|uniref:Uncharacterized protein n=1 Tax=Turnera subulata TaxID=218843 RepID=A0A9Q0FT71_9ROSI|nr:hypothetical protein Tsubulata_029295 [Turnera subulata]